MKIIDILNKKAKGTLEDGFKFRFKHFYYEYHKANNSFYNCESRIIFGNEFFLDECLNEEVDVIEENEEIKDLEKITFGTFVNANNGYRFDLTMKEYDKINELVRAVNKLIKESEVKQSVNSFIYNIFNNNNNRSNII